MFNLEKVNELNNACLLMNANYVFFVSLIVRLINKLIYCVNMTVAYHIRFSGIVVCSITVIKPKWSPYFQLFVGRPSWSAVGRSAILISWLLVGHLNQLFIGRPSWSAVGLSAILISCWLVGHLDENGGPGGCRPPG